MLAPLAVLLLILLASGHASGAGASNAITITRHTVIGVSPLGLNVSMLPVSFSLTLNGTPMKVEAAGGSGEYPLVLKIDMGPIPGGSSLTYTAGTLRWGGAVSLDLGGLRLGKTLDLVFSRLRGIGLVEDFRRVKVLTDYYALKAGNNTIIINTVLQGSVGMRCEYMSSAYTVTAPTTTRFSSTPTIPTRSKAQPTSTITTALSTTTIPASFTSTTAEKPAETTSPAEKSMSLTTSTGSTAFEKLASLVISAGIGLILAVITYLLVRQMF